MVFPHQMWFQYPQSKFLFQSKVMVKKFLKITEIPALPKITYILNYQRYRSQILITQVEDLNENEKSN